MILERSSFRLQMMMVVSIGAHLALLTLYASKPVVETGKKIELTEVEFQEEVAKPTEMEKLMEKLAAAKPAPQPPAEEEPRISALEELEKTSFQKVVGIKETVRSEEITEADLKNIATLPKLTLASVSPAPMIAKSTAPKLALTSKQNTDLRALESKVVPLDALPAADFGPGLSQRTFQQPEAIVQKVKSERRAQSSSLGTVRKLDFKRDAFISGEVKNREILQQSNPDVPQWLEEKGIEAEVVIQFVVNPDGEVGDKLFVQKTSGYAELDRLAIAALKKFVFAPLPLNAKQEEQKGVIVIRFRLNNS